MKNYSTPREYRRRKLKKRIQRFACMITLAAPMLPFLVAGAETLTEPNVTGATTHEVYAQTINEETTTYLVNVEWGNMQFVYDYSEPQWDATTTSYTEGGTPKWVEDAQTGTNGTNNQIKITNQSNAPITVGLQFNMTANVFNEVSGNDNVVGQFYDTNANAQAAALKLTATNEAINYTGKIDSLSLPTAASYTVPGTDSTTGQQTETTVGPGPRIASAYFAFSGTPDKDLKSSTTVGAISLAINTGDSTTN